MTSWLRTLGLRAAFLGVLIASVLVTQLAVARPNLPFALLDSFDRAFALVYDAAERKIARLEAAPPSARHDVAAILRALEDRVAVACDAAGAALEAELLVARSLSLERRGAVLGCIEAQISEAHAAWRQASDPEERAEYLATCEHLRRVRWLV